MQQFRVVKAFELHPKFKHFTKPVAQVMHIVRLNKSEYKAKTLKKTLAMIAEIVEERLQLLN